MASWRVSIWIVSLSLALGLGRGWAHDPKSISTIERDTFVLINQYRISEGFPALSWSNEMAEIARAHSRDMATGAVDFGHDGFNHRMEQMRAAWPALRGCGENVLMTSDPTEAARSAVALWLKSPPHRKNIRGDFTSSGIGLAVSRDGVIYFTELFMRVSPLEPER